MRVELNLRLEGEQEEAELVKMLESEPSEGLTGADLVSLLSSAQLAAVQELLGKTFMMMILISETIILCLMIRTVRTHKSINCCPIVW
jgi:hypothetical protein